MKSECVGLLLCRFSCIKFIVFQRLISVQSITSIHSLEIHFPLEYQRPYWRHKPAHFISHFVGHEGLGSLCSYLRRKGWITSLQSSQDDYPGFGTFVVKMNLTVEGFREFLFYLGLAM